MPTILEYYEYAKLTTASYVNMDAFPNLNQWGQCRLMWALRTTKGLLLVLPCQIVS